MKKQVTPELVWEALNRDPLFSTKAEAEKSALRPYVEKLPEILKDMLDTKVTLKNMSVARQLYSKYIMKNGFLEVAIKIMKEMIDSMPFALIDGGDAEKIVRQSLKATDKILKGIIDNLPAYLKEFGLTEREYMINVAGFNKKALKAYKAGNLTIGDLLLEQPGIIVGLQQQ